MSMVQKDGKLELLFSSFIASFCLGTGVPKLCATYEYIDVEQDQEDAS